MLATSYSLSRDDHHDVEIGVDEAGRGPLFGRVYAAAVILPKDCGILKDVPEQGIDRFAYEQMKDSKRFHSKKKIRQVAQYLREHPGVTFSVQYVVPGIIDIINIRQAVLRAMHEAIRDVIRKKNPSAPLLLIDGNDFKPYSHLVDGGETWKSIPHVTVEGGDNQYACIAAASILAKVAHDDYIADLCQDYPELVEKYALDKNVGYGTRQHLEGIAKHGITKWHRKSFSRCKEESSIFGEEDP